MNSIISKAFVFINEVLSTILVGLVLISGLAMMASGSGAGFFFGALTATVGTVLVVMIFGFAAIMIENHKLLQEIRDSLKK